MANYSALSKLCRLQNLVLAMNTVCGCAHASHALRPSQRLLTSVITASSAQATPNRLSSQQQQHERNVGQRKRITSPKRFYSDNRPSSNTASGGGGISSTIDEFRQREEEREREYDEQEAQDKSRNKTDSDSDSEQSNQTKVDAIRTQILEAALEHVPTLGWTKAAIVQGAEQVGLPSVVHGMFPDGGFALVSYFNGKCNENLVRNLQEETQNGQQEIGDPVEFLVRAVRMRLEMIEPYKKQWPQALALIALPQNASTSLAQVLTLVDDICYYSGDRSVNFDWYTRRIGLATILKMTEIYLLQDSSTSHTKTWEFLQNRMDEAVQLQMMLMQTGDMTNRFQRSFNSAFITARNILGLDYSRR